MGGGAKGDGVGSLGTDRSRNKGLLGTTCLVLLRSTRGGMPWGAGDKDEARGQAENDFAGAHSRQQGPWKVLMGQIMVWNDH